MTPLLAFLDAYQIYIYVGGIICYAVGNHLYEKYYKKEE